ncbi:MAG: hypothetical protein ACYTEG_10245 [Planctomycetota bacterium]
MSTFAMLLAEAQDAKSESYVEAYILGPAWLGPVVVGILLLFVAVASAWLIRRVKCRRAATK